MVLEDHLSKPASEEDILTARNYQLEAFDKARESNTIVFLETGSGKTFIAILLLRHYAYFFRKPSSFIAVFLVPTVVLVKQQAKVVSSHTDLNVGLYHGNKADFWDAATWKKEIDSCQVFVMTPQILLDAMRHGYIKLEIIKVIVMDECHHARGNHPYASIMKEFYHRDLSTGGCNLPRILGMTASLIKSKCNPSTAAYRNKILELENMLHSKVYTCESELVLSRFIPLPTITIKVYQHGSISDTVCKVLVDLKLLHKKHEAAINELNLNESDAETFRSKLHKRSQNLRHCVDELGVRSALVAADFWSQFSNNCVSYERLPASSRSLFLTNFSADASRIFSKFMGDGLTLEDNQSDLSCGFLTEKVLCLTNMLLEHRNICSIRCIVFVKQRITAVVLSSLLTNLLKQTNWKIQYAVGENSQIRYQTEKDRNDIVEDFRNGKVNIIIATSILEEGLDVQSCNLVIRFDPPPTLCSFIQSKGRARTDNSKFVVMVKRDDEATLARLKDYCAGGEELRRISKSHTNEVSFGLVNELDDDNCYIVPQTGAIATLDSSVQTIHFYCSHLPSDKYFKPCPRFVDDKENQECTLYLPKSSPVSCVKVSADLKIIKRKAALEACKQLHRAKALTDNLVPDIVNERKTTQLCDVPSHVHCPIYFSSEIASTGIQNSPSHYFCYLIHFKKNFTHEIPAADVMLAIRSNLSEISTFDFNLENDRGSMSVRLEYLGEIQLPSQSITVSRVFQATLFRILLDQNLNKLSETLNNILSENRVQTDYLLLPAKDRSIDWRPVFSVLSSSKSASNHSLDCPVEHNDQFLHTKTDRVCKCLLKDVVACTPHNGKLYLITGIIENLNGKSLLIRKKGQKKTYEEYFKEKYTETLVHGEQSLIRGRKLFPVVNCLHNRLGDRQNRIKDSKESHLDSENAYVELPPELCDIIMSHLSIGTLYSFSFLPSLMHRIESLLNAAYLKHFHLETCIPTLHIPTKKILEAITTKHCQEEFHLESLETLGDSFLKYATCQQLFKDHQNCHEGLLSLKKDLIVCNSALCKLACIRKLQGFIRNEPFDPKLWPFPGNTLLNEEWLTETRKMYVLGHRNLKSKRIADVVEALIGAYLSTGGEIAALSFMEWLGLKVDLFKVPYRRDFEVQAERHVDVHYVQSKLNYNFEDKSLLLEAVIHGSYMLQEIPRCYQRLEFLGDAVLDYLITKHFYTSYPELTPGLLTDMRSATVNNNCYALAVIKAGLYKHVCHASIDLHRHIEEAVQNVDKTSLTSTFGWESEFYLPKVLGDVIESLAGAILVDSNFDLDTVFRSIVPLLTPLVTPENVPKDHTRELHELCQRQQFKLFKDIKPREGDKISVSVEVEAHGTRFRHTSAAADTKTAKRLAFRQVLNDLKSVQLQHSLPS